MRKLPFLLLLLRSFVTWAQTDTSAITYSLSAYAEPYYAYDFGNPTDGNRPGFLYSHNRHNEFNVNLAYLKGAVEGRHFRGNLALMAGTYPNVNLAHEPATLQHILEANAGIGHSLKKGGAIWLDMGIFSSHLGFESAIGKDNWLLTRSLAAENSPFYEAGLKLSYLPENDKWFFGGFLLNGWQEINRSAPSRALSGGWQLQYKPGDRFTLNSSSFWGSMPGDSLDRFRFFHDFFAIAQLSDRFGLTLGFDTGWEKGKGSDREADFWWSPQVNLRYKVGKNTAFAGRIEYYSDESGVIIGGPFQTVGFALGIDHQVHQNAVVRLEGKLYNSEGEIFLDKDRQPTATNFALTTALAVWF